MKGLRKRRKNGVIYLVLAALGSVLLIAGVYLLLRSSAGTGEPEGNETDTSGTLKVIDAGIAPDTLEESADTSCAEESAESESAETPEEETPDTAEASEPEESSEAGVPEETTGESTAESTTEDMSETLYSGDGTFILYISGIDTRSDAYETSFSDVNILAAVNLNTGHVQLINTPRDAYLYVPTYGAMDKLTHAGYHGVDCSIATLEYLYNIRIDYYIRVNFAGFKRIINLLGGVDVYSEYAFSINGGTGSVSFVQGWNHLGGEVALAFVRERKAFADGDVQRGRNQMALLRGIISQLSSTEAILNFESIVDEVISNVQTDVPMNLVYEIIRLEADTGRTWTVDAYTLTGTGDQLATYTYPNETNYVMHLNSSSISTARRLIAAVLAE